MAASFHIPENYKYLLEPHSPDNREYYHPDKQWTETSIKIMNEVAEMCKNKENTYERIYRFVAAERAKIAQIKQVERYERYGAIRSDYTEWDSIFRSTKANCKTDCSEIYEWIAPAGYSKGSAWPKQYEAIRNYVENCLKEGRDGYEVRCNIRGYTRTISLVTLDSDGVIKIKYATPQYNFSDEKRDRNDFITGGQLFSSMLSAQTEEGYLSSLADYMRYESGILRSFLGSEGILQWIIGGVALYKGIQLSFKESEIGWNFRALITPCEQEYREFIKGIAEVSLIGTVIKCKIAVLEKKPCFFSPSKEKEDDFPTAEENDLEKVAPLKEVIQTIFKDESSPRVDKLYFERDLDSIIQTVKSWPSTADGCDISEKELKLRAILTDDFKKKVLMYDENQYVKDIQSMFQEEPQKQCLIM